MSWRPATLEGGYAWLMSVAGLVAGGVGLGMLIRYGDEGFRTLDAARLWFPWALLSAWWADSMWAVPLFVLCLQFPVYAAVLTLGVARGKFRRTAAALLIAHASASLVCFLFL
jgi:hypothetical protein